LQQAGQRLASAQRVVIDDETFQIVERRALALAPDYASALSHFAEPSPKQTLRIRANRATGRFPV
jgi:hypothetical protein